jgi:lipid-binding SYLF domain-containing protein
VRNAYQDCCGGRSSFRSGGQQETEGVAAGPGATAASASDADILTYGRAKGLFAGVSLGGATVEPDNDANYRLYGKTLTATDIVRGTNVKPPTDGQALVAALDSKLAKHGN